METAERLSVKLSFVVTVIERDFEDLLQLLESYKAMDERSETELIIEAESLSQERQNQLTRIVQTVPQISWFVNPGTSRCRRKDLGMMQAKADYLAYIDSDCIIQKDYYCVIRKQLGEHRVIRGENVYNVGNSYLARCSNIFRTLCDDVLFRNETFTPNLVIQKEFLRRNGGWDKDNIDCADDSVLSQRLKQRENFTVFRCDDAIMKINNSGDAKWAKLSKTWRGYGKGFQVRRRNVGKCDLRSFFQYLPRFPYRITAPISYFPMAVVIWFVHFRGYCEQINTDKRKG